MSDQYGGTTILELQDLVDEIMQDLVDELTYRSYRAQREQFPEVAPARWGGLYGYAWVEIMEKRFMREIGGGTSRPCAP